MKANIGRIFLRLIDKHFPRHHEYRKLFNRNNIKIATVVCQIWQVSSEFITPVYFRQKSECPLDKKYLSECLVYNASVDRLDTNKTKHY